MLKPSLVEKIGFGCGKLSLMPTLKSALYILDAALDNGINYFDTAPLYGRGYSEKILGKFSEKKRQKVIIATKVGLNPQKEYNLSASVALPLNYLKKNLKKSHSVAAIYTAAALPFRSISKEYVKTSFEKSLRNLKTDYIDNYFLHEAVPSFLTEDALMYLVQLKNAGYINKLGLAASYINYVHLDKNAIAIWDILQYEYSPDGSSTIVHDLFPYHKHHLHGILVNKKPPESILPIENRAGFMLLECLKSNIAERVLFSTSKINTLYTNIKSLNFYS